MKTMNPEATDSVVPDHAPQPKFRVIRESSEDVTIDEAGRIWKYTGEQVVFPGLEPEKILRALADVAAGRTVSLEELRARRR